MTTPLSHHASLALDSLAGYGLATTERSGTVTSNVWRLDYGEVRVFEQQPDTIGRVIVGVDMSGSMHCSESYCSHAKGIDTNASLAAQAAAAISTATDADVFGWRSHGGLEIQQWGTGQEPAECWGGQGGTPTAQALDYLNDQLAGETDGTVGVLITDGDASNMEQAKFKVKQMQESGVRFVVVVVGYSNEEYFEEIFPDTLVVTIETVEDLPEMGAAILEVIG